MGLMLAAGLLLGTRSTLTLTRDESGAVTAVNAWRFGEVLTLIGRSVTQVQGVSMKRMSLTESERRSTAYRDVFGMLNVPEQVTITGEGELRYPYREDFWGIEGFLKNKSNRQAVFAHPVDIRRTVASWFLLVFGGASLGGLIVSLVLGRDPLADLPNRVKPLPPKVGAAAFLGVILAGLWFFAAGHHVLGPLATKKLANLTTAANANDAAGVDQAVRQGVFVDARDGQGVTALMVAARAGAADSVRALLAAGANPGLRDGDDRTALVHAIAAKQSAVALQLLDGGSDLAAADLNGRNALHHAAASDEPQVLRRLVLAGADVNQPDAHGWTALVFAAAHGSESSVRALLEAGADPLRKTADGRTAIDLAERSPTLRELLVKEAAAKP